MARFVTVRTLHLHLLSLSFSHPEFCISSLVVNKFKHLRIAEPRQDEPTEMGVLRLGKAASVRRTSLKRLNLLPYSRFPKELGRHMSTDAKSHHFRSAVNSKTRSFRPSSAQATLPQSLVQARSSHILPMLAPVDATILNWYWIKLKITRKLPSHS